MYLFKIIGITILSALAISTYATCLDDQFIEPLKFVCSANSKAPDERCYVSVVFPEGNHMLFRPNAKNKEETLDGAIADIGRYWPDRGYASNYSHSIFLNNKYEYRDA